MVSGYLALSSPRSLRLLGSEQPLLLSCVSAVRLVSGFLAPNSAPLSAVEGAEQPRYFPMQASQIVRL
jgi:hypothetical protein